MYTKTVTPPATSIGETDFPADPVRSGYVFLNWNTQADGAGSYFNAYTTVDADITVYAQWVAVYTVTFKSNDGTNDTLYIRTIRAGFAIVDSPANPSRTGYYFMGWNTASDWVFQFRKT